MLSSELEAHKPRSAAPQRERLRTQLRLDPRSCLTCGGRHPSYAHFTADAAPTHDLSLAGAAARWLRPLGVERDYARHLRSVARVVASTVRGVGGSPGQLPALANALRGYATTLDPWARAVAARMLAAAEAANARAWLAQGRALSARLQASYAARAGAAAVLQARERNQVKLIQSLPAGAAERVLRLGQKFSEGRLTPAALEAAVSETADVVRSRAEGIAVTEAAGTATDLTQVRAQALGSTHYLWHSQDDDRVRPRHRQLHGQIIAWDNPPICDPPHRAHAGAIWNCRCVPIPVLPN